mmetsp:Transcript_36997/g.89900  ORF Transcript_36997/g.89900 Transcript_36997/m.89900 type:complete len:224 (+) Transcript_36997:2784-3455(+)
MHSGPVQDTLQFHHGCMRIRIFGYQVEYFFVSDKTKALGTGIRESRRPVILFQGFWPHQIVQPRLQCSFLVSLDLFKHVFFFKFCRYNCLDIFENGLMQCFPQWLLQHATLANPTQCPQILKQCQFFVCVFLSLLFRRRLVIFLFLFLQLLLIFLLSFVQAPSKQNLKRLQKGSVRTSHDCGCHCLSSGLSWIGRKGAYQFGRSIFSRPGFQNVCQSSNSSWQ